jgi:hypothetical protein
MTSLSCEQSFSVEHIFGNKNNLHVGLVITTINNINLLYGAEQYSRGHYMLGHLIVSKHLMEPEGSIPNPQELSTCSYPEPDQSSPHHPILTPQDPS